MSSEAAAPVGLTDEEMARIDALGERATLSDQEMSEIEALGARVNGAAPAAAAAPVSTLGPSTRENQEATQAAELTQRMNAEARRRTLFGGKGYVDLTGGETNTGRGISGTPTTPAQDAASAAELRKKPVVGPLVSTVEAFGPIMQGQKSTDAALGAGFDAAGAAIAVPFSVALSMTPESVKGFFEGAAEGLDKYAAVPLGQAVAMMTGKRSAWGAVVPQPSPGVRSATNVLGGIVAGYGAAKGGARVGGAVLDATALRNAPKPGVPQGGVYGDTAPGRAMTQPMAPETPPNPLGGLRPGAVEPLPVEPRGGTGSRSSSSIPDADLMVMEPAARRVNRIEQARTAAETAQREWVNAPRPGEVGGSRKVLDALWDQRIKTSRDYTRAVEEAAESVGFSVNRDTPISRLFPDKTTFLERFGGGLDNRLWEAWWDSGKTINELLSRNGRANQWLSDSPPGAIAGRAVAPVEFALKEQAAAQALDSSSPVSVEPGVSYASEPPTRLRQPPGTKPSEVPPQRVPISPPVGASVVGIEDLVPDPAPRPVQTSGVVRRGASGLEVAGVERPRALFSEGGTPVDPVDAAYGRSKKPAAARSEPIDLETPPASPGASERATGGWGDREPTTMGVGYAVDRNIDTLKRYGKAGEDLSARVRTVRDEVRGETHRFDQELKDATSGLTKADRKLLTEHGYDLMTGKMAPPNPQVAAAIRWWNGEGTGQTVKIAEYVNESGSLVTDPGGQIKPHKINPNTPNWAPHIYKGEFLDAVGRNDPAALAIVDKMVGEGKQFRTRAEAVEGLKNYRDAELKSLNPSTERPRYIQDPPSEVLEQDFFKLARDHAYGAFRSAAEHRAFKYLDPTGAPRNVRPGGAPQGELGDLLEQIKRERGSPDAAAAEAKVLDLLGRNPVDRSSVARLQREVGEGVGAFNAIRFYTNPVSWLRNLTQAPSVYSFVGEGPFAEGALRLAKDYQAVKTRALRTGEVDALMHHAETIGLVDETIAGQAASAGRKASNAAMIPFELADRQARLLASASAEPFAKSLREGLNGSERQARIANAKLDAMDIPADMRQRLKAGEFTEADMNRFKRELVDLTNVRINRATKIPASAASGLDRNTRYQGKNFAIEQTRAFKRIAVDQLRAGNPLPALRLVGTAGPAVGYTFTKLVNALTGDSDKEVTPVDVVRNAGAGGAGGDFIASMIPDEKGRTRARQTIENWNSSQWDSFMADLGTLADKMVSPGKRRISIGDMTVVAPKDRWDALLEFLKEVAPSFEKNVKITEKIDLEEMIK